MEHAVRLQHALAGQRLPQQLPAPEGLVRWTPIEGATSYEVLYTDFAPATSFQTTTNVADEREYFTFHTQLGVVDDPLARARDPLHRRQDRAEERPAARVSYGPWSPTFTTVNPPQSLGHARADRHRVGHVGQGGTDADARTT